ncbi:MAG TPA: lysylphosphatidylglycerol synthase transmembrane domain-containing protein [Chloroflexota bacterium]|nr:lysylphosphatidylglycerol synthase transmembrane domain-containing protein [Chloroflexota bacterium]
MKRSFHIALGAIISLIFLILAIRGLDLEHVGQAMGGAAYGWLIPALVLYFSGVWVRTVRWQYLLRPLQIVSTGRLFPVVVMGYMANNVLPARLGEFARCYVLRRREGIPQTAALGTVLLERIMDGLTMLAFMGVALPPLPFSASLYQLMLGAGALFGTATAGLIVLVTRPVLTARLLALIARPLPGMWGTRIQGLGATFLSGFATLGGGAAALRVFGLSCIAWLLEAGMYLVLMFAFPFIPSLPLAILTTAVVNLGTLIPSSPGYVGVFDFIGKSVLAQFGVPEATALAYVLVVHAALVVPITLLGFWYAWREGVSLSRLANAAPTRQNTPAVQSAVTP